MSQRLPKCAHCGGSLARRGYVVVTWKRCSGRPRAGWHAGEELSCWRLDGLQRTYFADDTDDLATIAEIESRGPERISRRARRTALRHPVPAAG